MSYEVVLKCFHCKTKKVVEVAKDPLMIMPYEYVAIAIANGWDATKLDCRRNRPMFFCCEEHGEREQTPIGWRKNPIGVGGWRKRIKKTPVIKE